MCERRQAKGGDYSTPFIIYDELIDGAFHREDLLLYSGVYSLQLVHITHVVQIIHTAARYTHSLTGGYKYIILDLRAALVRKTLIPHTMRMGSCIILEDKSVLK